MIFYLGDIENLLIKRITRKVKLMVPVK